jgi:hypothetical protein
MNVDLIPILNQYGQSTVQRIRNNLATTGTNATGKTSQSVRFEVTQDGTVARMRIYGRPYFMATETGIKPYPQYNKPSREFVAAIREWLAAVGGEQGAAYAIARSIHKKGTKLYQSGGRKTIVSNVIPDLNTQIQKSVLDEFVKAYIANLQK